MGYDLFGTAPKSRTGEYFREKVELPFFEYHLKGVGENKLPKALVLMLQPELPASRLCSGRRVRCGR